MKYFYVCLSVIALLSCNGNVSDHEPQDIQVDFNKSKTVDVSTDGKVIQLETSDSTLIYDICNLEYADGKYYIHSRDFIRVFDSQGNFVRNISQRGNGNTEYNQISSMFVQDDKVHIYDWNKEGLAYYNLDGGFVGRSKVELKDPENETKPMRLFPNKNGWVSLNTFGGDQRQISALSLWDEELKNSQPIEGRNLSSGTMLYDGVYVDDEILYWEPVCDTLFHVEENKIQPLYHFDFGEYALPAEIASKATHERLMYMTELNTKEDKFAGMPRFFQRRGDYLYFSCIAPDFKIRLCRYDESKGEVEVFLLNPNEDKYKVMPFFKIVGDDIIMELHDEATLSNNPLLLIYDINKL